MRKILIVLSMLLLPTYIAQAEVSVGIGINVPGISIGINLPAYPRLVRVPGYPVYYDPRVDFNYFFYDGMYWVFQADNWYASSWYNGPWYLVERRYVPIFLLRVPVRYYRKPPSYFRDWRTDASPRWSERWGRDWEDRREEWNQWNRRPAPRPAPLPNYQRSYSGERYPQKQEQQRQIRTERYRYQPRESVTKQYFEQKRQQTGSPEKGRKNQHEERERR